LLLRADVGVVPLAQTPFTEIMAPNKLFEYVALGKPVIASRLAGIERYFTDREVLFVEPGDASALAAAIERLYADPALRDQLSSRALERFKAYRWSSVVDDYLEALTGRSTG
jgi:glycosyltransferase involved in cell wall biosynthesis